MQRAIFPDLEGVSVFITGGGSGIGAALTEGFLAQGARVGFVQRSDATAFCNDMEARFGSKPLFIACDITDVEALRGAVAEVARAHGDPTVLVNNAANDLRHETMEVTEEFWDRNQAINLKPYFFAAQAVIPGMQRAGGGRIVNFSSVSYMMGIGEYPSYAAANAGIVGLTRAQAREFGASNIRVNALAPGWTMTQKQIDLWVTPEKYEAFRARQCLSRPIVPEDMVAPALFLASEASAAITGQCLPVDGGVVVTG
jgi:NAD(P)-dependent dehydrogenase (short-subunit alcohol dehydrogenase family)